MIELPYGNIRATLSLKSTVIMPAKPRTGPTLREVLLDVEEALQHKRSVCVIVPDDTRPAAHRRILPSLIPLLANKDVTIVVACGAHASPGSDFLREIVQMEPHFKLHVHDCDHSPMSRVGTTRRGTPVIVNNELLRADALIAIGSVAIHPFAGLSGGPKAFVPGCADRSTITANHSLLTEDNSVPGKLDNNPLYLDLIEAVKMLKAPYIINEALSPEGHPIGHYFGPCATTHRAAAELALEAAAAPIDGLFDVVIVSAGGHPRDINLYQAIKALEMSSLACKDGGTLILLAQCPKGIGSKLYEDWAKKDLQEQTLMVKNRFTVGAHKAYLASRVLKRLSQCVLVSDMAPELSRQMGFIPANTLEEALELLHIPSEAKIGAMPYGTATLPMLRH